MPRSWVGRAPQMKTLWRGCTPRRSIKGICDIDELRGSSVRFGAAPFDHLSLQLQSSSDNEDQQNHDDQTQPPARVVAPAAAIRPGRECSQQEKDQNY